MTILCSIQNKTGQYGPFTVLNIDGREFTVGKHCTMDPALVVGDSVEYEAAPSKTGRMYVNRIRKITGGGSTPATASVPTPTHTQTQTPQDSNLESGSLPGDTAKDTDIRRQVMWKLASEQIAQHFAASGTETTEPASEIARLGERLFDLYQAARRGNRPT